MNENKKQPLIEHTWFLIIMCLFVTPVGLILLWVSGRPKNIILRIMVTAMLILVVGSALLSPKSDKTRSETATVQNIRTEKTEEADIKETKKQQGKEDNASSKKKNKKETPEQKTEETVPREYKNALKKAESYASIMHMSKQGIYDQLTSEYGESFPEEAAQYAIENVKANWKENALIKAQEYSKNMSMSDDAIYEQLVSDYGEKFTEEEAKYAIEHLE